MSEQKDYIEFYNGIRMPFVGLGTYQIYDEALERALDTALELGYRLIDTAYVYENEAAIGRALKKWFDSGRLKREDVFIITKLPNIGFKRELVEKYLKRSLEAMQLSYVDLYLVHQTWGVHERGEDVMPKNEEEEVLIDPTTDHVSIWKICQIERLWSELEKRKQRSSKSQLNIILMQYWRKNSAVRSNGRGKSFTEVSDKVLRKGKHR